MLYNRVISGVRLGVNDGKDGDSREKKTMHVSMVENKMARR